MRRWFLAMVAAAVAVTGCDEQLICPAGKLACGGSCAEVALDPANCGACGVACGAGEACQAGACTDCASACGDGQTCEHGVCRADLYVACAATDEVVGITTELALAGPARAVDDGPVALAWLGDRVWAAHGFSTPTLVGFTPGVAGNQRHTLGGDYLNGLRAAGGLLYVSSHAGTLVVVDPVSGVKDEIALGAVGVEVNPRGIGVAGSRAAVALAGDAITPAWGEGQEIAVVDVGPSAACTAPPCGTVVGTVSLDVPASAGVVGAYDPPGFPFPSGAATVGTRAFVTLGNLREAGGFYGTPAGNGRLVAFDSLTTAAPTFVDLGAACQNPGAITVDGTTLFVACGVYDDCFATGTGNVVPVDVSGVTPVVGAPLPVPVVPASVAVCGSNLFVGDTCTGKVARIPAAGGAATSEAICAGSFPFVPDLICAGGSP